MVVNQVAELLLDLALLFALTYLLAGLLERVRIPGILAALFVAMAVHYTPLGVALLSPEFHVPLSFLADLGVLFLLFFIGLQIDLKEMRDQSGDIIWLTVLNTTRAVSDGYGGHAGAGLRLAAGFCHRINAHAHRRGGDRSDPGRI